ncbi:hypothetical protein [Streptosporangium sandarakinum]
MTDIRTLLLRDGMEVMVPMAIDKVRDWSEEDRQAAAIAAADVIACGADELWEHNPKKRELPRGRVTSSIAHGLAVLAYQPGGIDWAGGHWCVTPHDGCPKRSAR